MRSVAILVIAALNQPVYRHYLERYWSTAVRYCDGMDNVDVFLLFEHGTALDGLRIPDHAVIVEPDTDYAALCPRKFQLLGVPGILSKTLHALEALQDRYDVFFRTNLSSVIKLESLNRFVQAWPDPGYAGAFVWADALREDLLHYDRVGEGKSIRSLSELDGYPGNTFISGSGFFLNAAEAASLVAQRNRIRFDIIDDVSVGLMLPEHQLLTDFTLILRPESVSPDSVGEIVSHPGCQVRLQHFPLHVAEKFWLAMQQREVWAL